jgi:TonB-linked SusC/RagA family outer membrane protein
VATDSSGHFSILANVNELLTFSYVGMQTTTMKVTASRNHLLVMLEENVNDLNHVVVVGYSTQKKADLTGAVSVVSLDDIKTSVTGNSMKAIQGRVPGVFVTTDGNPNGNATVQIRGITTLNDNSPLYIVDGVPMKSGINQFNTNDIESMQVLKDPSSASIYGARASNGVIIITTKQGKKGRTSLDFSSSLTASRYNTKLQVLNTEQRGRALWQAAINDGTSPDNLPIYKYQWHVDPNAGPVLDHVIIPTWVDSAAGIKSADTKWFDEISRTGLVQSYNLAFSTGSDKGSTRIALGYYDNKGIIKETGYKRATARVNSQYNLFNDRLKIGENISLSGSQAVPDAGAVGLAEIVQPILPVHTTSGGWAGPSGAGFDDRDNPARVVDDTKWNRLSILDLVGNTYLDFSILKNLSVKTNFGVQYEGARQKIIDKTFQSGFLSRTINDLNVSQADNINWTWNNTIDYHIRRGGHYLDVLAGMEMIKNNADTFSAYRENFALQTPDYFYLNAGTGNKNNAGIGGGYSLLSYFGKLNYAYEDKYLVSGTLRYDGSSRFGGNNKFGLFPAFSLGWRLIRENFIQQNLSFLSDLKLRFGWGQTGNQEISNNAIYALYIPQYGDPNNVGGISNGTAYGIAGQDNGTLPSGFLAIQQANPNLKWETTTGTNTGLDFGFFNQKLSGSIDYYVKNTRDILVLSPYAAVIGDGGSQWKNGASVHTSGIDFMLEYQNNVGDLGYSVAANISHYKSEITRLPPEVVNAYPGNSEKTILGHSPNAYFGYIADGIFATQQEVNDHAVQPGKAIGRLRYSDLNGDGVVDDLDQDYIGSADPDFIYGVNIGVSYKHFDLSLFFQGVQGINLYNSYKIYSDFTSVWGGSNYGKRTLDAWTPQNSGSLIPALTLADNNNEKRMSTYFVENASYLKWRNLQIGYNFHSRQGKSAGGYGMRVYVQAENLAIFKDNKGARSFSAPDPENPSSALPRPFNLTVGLNITL